MTDDNYFPGLNRTGLIKRAGDWASKYKQIKRITLHHYKESDIYKYLVLVALEGNPSPNNTMPDLGLSPQYWHGGIVKDGHVYPDTNSQIEKNIIWDNFTHEKTLSDAYIDGKPPVGFNNQWFLYPIFDGEQLPEFASSYSWEIYPCIKDHEEIITDTNPDERQNSFIRRGDTWVICFNGKELNPIPHMDGLSYIAELLKKSPVPIHATTLCDAISPQNRDDAMMEKDDLIYSLDSEAMSISNMQDEGFDETGKKQILKKLDELKETMSDITIPIRERETAKNNYDAIIKTLKSQYDRNSLSNKVSRKVNKAVKNDMDKVKKAIDRAIDKIKEQSSILADYLQINIKTGEECSFKDANITWNISF